VQALEVGYLADNMRKSKNLRYTISVPALIAGQMILYDEETTLRHLRYWIPFSSMNIINKNNTVNVDIMFDYATTKIITCLSNGTKDVTDQPIRTFSVTNTHAIDALVDGDVKIILEK
jgi:hypothetical protein